MLPNHPDAPTAACREHDPELWFPDTREHTKATAAKTICADCPLQTACLEEALDYEAGHGDRWGIRGGLTAAERAQVAKFGPDSIPPIGHIARCAHGHPPTPPNTYITPAGSHQFRACKRLQVAERRRRKREAA